ncbi:MAG: glycosyltransferase family 4 protein [Cyanomargarita calcarea GSE-NOS-MK-12-04C]|jgi:glycosyltransferase involved in cell wall biosynthesis|uniref:Glycosyltransferase family 4 protein n=1 Tax=Cyanomargarita calcarea GSE-NOS-MK-12-04C TaxID=2839659 RepID=A0A951QW37_9CYAN|nr:glycosyltransferase family 4 protein [Cyanomargarita calcarea GSE-NOS-MK-12-04C]
MNSSAKLIILYIITKSDLGGAQGNVYDLISNFHKDCEVHLAVGCHGHLTEDVSVLGVPIHIIPSLTRSIKLFGDCNAVKECISLINKIKPDIIHAHSSKAGVIARIAGWITKTPTVFTAHGWGFTPGTPRFRRTIALIAEKRLASLSGKLICVSESDRSLAKNCGVGNDKSLIVVRYGIENIPVTLANTLQQPPRLIMVARFNEQKDQATLLKAIAEIKKYNFHLDLVGSGVFLESCQALAKSLEITDKVSFLGDRRDVPELLAKSQIFILSTHYEGLPISILEAMRGGLPVVATSVNGIPEEIEDEKTGLLVPRQDAEALADALSRLIQAPEIRQQMGEAAREKFMREFTIDRMVNETRNVYKSVL